MMNLPYILDRRFRTGAAFYLKDWHQLQNHERQLLTQLSGDEGIYGLFLPARAGGHQTAKLAYTDTALLYFHFQHSRHLPKAFTNRPEELVNKTLLHLVLDRVLEIEWQEDFVSGSQAMEAIYGYRLFSGGGSPGPLSSVSMQAIAMAFLLPHREAKLLARWLYTCHTWPLDSTIDKTWSEQASLYAFLFPEEKTNTRRLLKTAWRFVPPQAGFSWFSWLRHSKPLQPTQPTFKLYISPAPPDLPAVLSAVVPVLTESKAFSFKVGATMPDLLRPDKLIAYFTQKEALLETAALLEKRLPACRVHGVPFSCQLDQRGLLSWGTDPPSGEVLDTVEDGSWRTWVTEQLALAILQAKEDHQTFAAAVPFLQAKLQVAGINMENWTAME